MANESHRLRPRHVIPRKFANDRYPSAMKSLADARDRFPLPELMPTLSGPYSGPLALWRIPRINLALTYQVFDDRDKLRVQCRNVNLSSLGAKRDSSLAQVHVLAKIYPGFCQSTALVTGNLETGVEHLSRQLASGLWNFLTNQGYVLDRQFRLALYVIASNPKSYTGVRFNQLSLHSFTHDETQCFEVRKGGVVEDATATGREVVIPLWTTPVNVIETQLSRHELGAVGLATQKEQQRSPVRDILRHDSNIVPIPQPKPVLDPTPTGRFPVTVTNLLDRGSRFKSACLANFNWVFGRVTKAGRTSSSNAVRAAKREPVKRAVLAHVNISHERSTA